MFYNENTPSRVLGIDSNFNDLETIFLEFSHRNKKWFRVGLYNPPNQNGQHFTDRVSKSLTKLSSHFHNIILLGQHFIIKMGSPENWNLDTFRSCFDVESLIKAPACFQSTHLTCIDLLLANKKNFFKNSNVLEAKIFDHHNLALTALKGALSGLRQFLATESPLKMIKNDFHFTSKALFKIFKFLS